MKKKLYLLFGLLLSLLLVGVVNAKGPYYLDWETEEQDRYEVLGNMPYNGGYLTVDRDIRVYTLKTYDKTGKELKSKKLLDYDLADITTYEDKIITVLENNDGLFIQILNSDLEVEKEKEITSFGVKYFIRLAHTAIYVDANKIAIPTNEGIAIYNYDLDLEETKEPTDKNIKKYFPDYAKGVTLLKEYNDGNTYETTALGYTDGYSAIAVYEDFHTCANFVSPSNPEGTELVQPLFDEDCGEYSLRLLNDDGEKEWSVKVPSGEKIQEIEFLNGHIAAISYSKVLTKIYIYDMNGELLQTIRSSLAFSFLRKTNYGFIVTQNTCGYLHRAIFNGEMEEPVGPGGQRSKERISARPVTYCEGNHQVYYFNKEIKAVVTEGKGNVEVAKEQRPGEPVTFVVTPDEGYVIGVIKVTDVNGNVITFTKNDLNGNTFTMPTADVTIEVEFLVENAKTADIAITFIAIVAGFAGIMYLTNKKKLKGVA